MIILYAEEVDPTISANIQIVKELRDALDHLMRLIINKASPGCENGSYSLAQIDKAVGHVYRAAFDALDGTVLSLKIKINDCLCKYNIDVIKEVLSNYWKIKILLNKLSSQISENRSHKDVEKNHADLFDKYVSEVEELKIAYDEILNAGTTLDEYQSAYEKNIKSKIKTTTTISYKTAIAGGIVGAVIAVILSYYFLSPTNTSTIQKDITTSISQPIQNTKTP